MTCYMCELTGALTKSCEMSFVFFMLYIQELRFSEFKVNPPGSCMSSFTQLVLSPSQILHEEEKHDPVHPVNEIAFHTSYEQPMQLLKKHNEKYFPLLLRHSKLLLF